LIHFDKREICDSDQFRVVFKMLNKTFALLSCLLVFAEAFKVERGERGDLPREIFRDDVEPKRGGKVPEAAKSSQRIELNKLDAVGLDRNDNKPTESFFSQNDIRDQFFQDPFSSVEEDYSLDFPYNPVFDPIKISGSSETNKKQQSKYTNPYAAIYDSLFKKPTKAPGRKSSKDTYKYIDIDEGNLTPDPYYNPPRNSYDPRPPASYEPPAESYSSYEPPAESYNNYEPPVESYNSYEPPKDAYDPYYESPAPPSYVEPEPYKPPKPKGPVLLEKRPYEVKSVQPLPITVAESYTSFDCRNLYPGRHYADPETGCQVYHFCHQDGKQDTFTCGYGTVFNEYIGTCDYKNNVQCQAGEGYIPDTPDYHPPHPPPEPSYPPPHRYEQPSFQNYPHKRVLTPSDP